MVLMVLIAAGILDPLTVKLENTVLLQGSFVQSETWALTRESEVTRGVMSLAHPNLFLLEYSDPEGRVMGCDGGSVFTIEPRYREVVQYTGSSPEGFLHLLLNSDREGMTTEGSARGDTVTVRVSGDMGGGINSLCVKFSMVDSLPFFFSTSDINGNLTEWQLSNLETRGSVPDSRFRLTVPSGYALLSEER